VPSPSFPSPITPISSPERHVPTSKMTTLTPSLQVLVALLVVTRSGFNNNSRRTAATGLRAVGQFGLLLNRSLVNADVVSIVHFLQVGLETWLSKGEKESLEWISLALVSRFSFLVRYQSFTPSVSLYTLFAMITPSLLSVPNHSFRDLSRLSTQAAISREWWWIVRWWTLWWRSRFLGWRKRFSSSYFFRGSFSRGWNW